MERWLCHKLWCCLVTGDYRTVTFCDPLAKSADLNDWRFATPA